MDTSIIAILPYDPTQNWIFKDCKPSVLTKNDYQEIETMLAKSIDAHNAGQEHELKQISIKHHGYKVDKENFLINLKNYRRQYIVVTNSKNEKEVWVNCFCDNSHKNWQKELIMVRDGGNCYFNFKINLTTKKYCKLSVNGSA